MRPTDVATTIQALSAPRLSGYRAYFSTTDDHDLYGCYQWNSELSRSILPLMHLIEVTFRNSCHRELSRKHAAVAGKIGSNTSNDWYSHVKLSKHSQESIKKIKKKTTRPDDVISRLTFGFWSNLLDVPDVIPLLPAIFPNTSRNLAHLKNVDFVYARMQMINNLRNRTAHWEPMWKFGALMPEKRERPGSPRLIPTAQATTTPSQSIARMAMLYDRMNSFLSMMDAGVSQTYDESYTHEHFRWVCSEAGLAAHRTGKKNRPLPLTTAKRNFTSLVRGKNLITITTKHGPAARLVPL